ncbi:hypothetical protein HCG49_00805 [Arenibacter sp. 6A1]|uniref:hypothetical protein n=1 Tax=Arenibacter sp. 6A1 TaxID=2720391 RepID=UPI0014471A52|nr:hypothetical protein [Arenibacter sp. 6A1]NKI25096.1 hypothetical protein [Arenibacter sp. 6A1]
MGSFFCLEEVSNSFSVVLKVPHTAFMCLLYKRNDCNPEAICDIFGPKANMGLGVPSLVGRAIGYIPCDAAGMPPLSLTRRFIND